MKHELDRMMDLIKDYKTGYGGVTDSFMRKELEIFAKDYHAYQLRKHAVSDPVCRTFMADGKTTSATKCIFCGKEQWEHPLNGT